VPRYRREPTNRELRERVIAMMKQTRLFEGVSVRLLADLVDRNHLIGVPPAPAQLAGVNPAVLAVPEGAIELFMDGMTIWPPPPVALPVALLVPVPLSAGIYLRNLGPLRGLGNWNSSALRAVGKDAVRIFLLPLGEFVNKLPRVLLNALDPHVADIVAV
jgi:hypothetical protein